MGLPILCSEISDIETGWNSLSAESRVCVLESTVLDERRKKYLMSTYCVPGTLAK